MICECHEHPMSTRWGRFVCRVEERTNAKNRNRAFVLAEQEARGDACEDCGNTEHLEWHHRDPSTKFKHISRMISERYSLNTLGIELDKCDLLCKDCHVAAQRALKS